MGYGFRDQAIAQNRRMSRQLAMRAASFTAADNTDEDQVLAAMTPIEEFLLGGDTTDTEDMVARRSAVQQHMDNLRQQLRSGSGDVAGFVAAVRKYYGRLMPEGPAADEAQAFREITARLADPEAAANPRRAQMLAIIREAGEDGITSGAILIALARVSMAVNRETLQRWLAAAELAGLVRRISGRKWRGA